MRCGELKFSEKQLNRLCKQAKAEELRMIRQEVFEAVNCCDRERCRESLERLFQDKLKKCFDYYVLEENLVFLKRFYIQACEAYDIPVEEKRNQIFDYSRYPKLESLKNGIFTLFETCMDSENRHGRHYGRIVRECIQIIKANYGKADLSLPYIAEQLNISANYLSSVFKKEVHSNIVRYIMWLRIEKAKQLLCESCYHVGEISGMVGFENKRYFSECFKKETGYTPKEYRLQKSNKNLL